MGIMRMGSQGLVISLALGMLPVGVFAKSPQTYNEAKIIWENSKDKADYQTYLTEFAQFNNHFHLDERGGCYALDLGTVDLMLVISNPTSEPFAMVAAVFTNIDNRKAQCFKNLYRDLKTKIPPFFPFVLELHMAGGVGT